MRTESQSKRIYIPKEATLYYDDNKDIIIEVNVIKDFKLCTPTLCRKENRIIAELLDKLSLAKYYKTRAKLIVPRITELNEEYSNTIILHQIERGSIIQTNITVSKR